MILLEWTPPQSIQDVQALVQTAINLEFSTLPPYLYAKFSIPDGVNLAASQRLEAIIRQEMIHMCLACNIMNAIGGSPQIQVPSYPGPLPGDIGNNLTVHLYAFSQEAAQQGMDIETPIDPIDPPQLESVVGGTKPVTIGQFYMLLDGVLSELPASSWTANRNQVWDNQYFQGQIYAVNNYTDANNAIQDIISEGEGSPQKGSPLDFQNELAHYYRFEEIFMNQLLVKADNSVGYAWGAPLGVDWNAVYPAINDPEQHNFSNDPPAAQAAQAACNSAFSTMVDELSKTFNGDTGRLGNAVGAMFQLRMAALRALVTPLADGTSVAGPSFKYITTQGATS